MEAGRPSDGEFKFVEDSHVGDDSSLSARCGHKSMNTVVASLRQWADLVAKWMDTPDLWEISRQGGSDSIPGQSSPDSTNTPFAPNERELISDQLKTIAEGIKKTYDLTVEQAEKIDQKFEEAAKAAERMGRKDWGLLFGGAVFSLILGDVITPGIAGHILMLVEHGIGYLFMGGPPHVGGILSGGQD